MKAYHSNVKKKKQTYSNSFELRISCNDNLKKKNKKSKRIKMNKTIRKKRNERERNDYYYYIYYNDCIYVKNYGKYYKKNNCINLFIFHKEYEGFDPF